MLLAPTTATSNESITRGGRFIRPECTLTSIRERFEAA